MIISRLQYLKAKLQHKIGAWFYVYEDGDNLFVRRGIKIKLKSWTDFIPDKVKLENVSAKIGFHSGKDRKMLCVWKSLDEIKKGFKVCKEDLKS